MQLPCGRWRVLEGETTVSTQAPAFFTGTFGWETGSDVVKTWQRLWIGATRLTKGVCIFEGLGAARIPS
jgi:hypothetical protein